MKSSLVLTCRKNRKNRGFFIYRRPSGLRFSNRNDSDSSDQIGDSLGHCFYHVTLAVKIPGDRGPENPRFLRFLRQVRTRLKHKHDKIMVQTWAKSRTKAKQRRSLVVLSSQVPEEKLCFVFVFILCLCRSCEPGLKKYNELINSLVCLYTVEHTDKAFNKEKTKSLISIFYIEHTNDQDMKPLSLDELKQ